MRNTVQIYIDGNRLDLFQEEQIVLKNQIKDIRDPKKIFSPFTHNFKVPASKANNRIFKHVLRTDNDELDPRRYFDAVIEVNNVEFRRGFIKLDGNHEIKSGRVYSYNLRFFDKFVQIARLLSEITLEQMPTMAPYAVNYTNAQIHNLLKNGPSDDITDDDLSDAVKDNIRFVLNSYDGIYFYDTSPDYDSDDNIEDDTLADNGIQGVEQDKLRNIADVTDAVGRDSDGVRIKRLHPSLKMEAILNALEQYDFYDGAPRLVFSRGLDENDKPTSDIDEVVEGKEHFFGTSVWDELYMLLKTKGSTVASGGIIEWSNDWQWHVPGKFDPCEGHEQGDSPYVVQVGPYRTNFNNLQHYYLWLNARTTTTDVPYKITLFDTKNGNVKWTSGWIEAADGAINNDYLLNPTTNLDLTARPVFNFNNNGVTALCNTSDNISVDLGDKSITAFGRLPRDCKKCHQQWAFKIETEDQQPLTFQSLKATIVEEEADKDFAEKWSRSLYFYDNEVTNLKVGTSSVPQMKIVDWLTGIFKLFNLVAYYTVDNNGDDIIVVDTLNNFYDDGKTRDITKWVDNQDVTLQTPKVFSDIKFEFEDPSTLFGKNYKENNPTPYGGLKHDLREDTEGNIVAPFLPKNSYDIKVPFEQFILSEVQSPDSIDANIYYGLITGDSYEDTDIKPMLHFIDNRTAHGNILYKDETLDKVTGLTNADEYNVMTPFYRDDSDELIQSLNFGIESDIIFADESFDVDDANTLFKNYWEDYIVESFRNKAYIYDFKAKLPMSLVSQITLGDKLIIGDNEYRINKFSTNLNDSRNKLELVSLNDPTVGFSAAPQTQADKGTNKNTIVINSLTANPGINLTDEISSVTFTVDATGGNSTLSYTWYKNGSEISGETTSTLTETSFSDGDNYYVIVSDDDFMRQSATLTINVVTETLSALSLTNFSTLVAAGSDETLTITGDTGTPYTISIYNTSPSGWIGNSALDSTSGTISGGSNTHTLTVPVNDTMDDRTATIRVINSNAHEDYNEVSITQQGAAAEYTLSGTVTDSVTGATITAPLTYSVTGTEGSTVTFAKEITANSGYSHSNNYTENSSIWGMSRSGNTLTFTATMPGADTTDNFTVSGSASAFTYSVSGEITGTLTGCTIDSKNINGTRTVTSGGSETFTLTPNANHTFSSANDATVSGLNQVSLTSKTLLANGNIRIIVGWSAGVGNIDDDFVINATATADNIAPTAVITGATSGTAGTAVSLSGASSSDSDGSISSYSWTVSSGCTLSSSSGASTSVNRTNAGDCTVSLVVQDNDGADSTADTHTVTFAAAPTCFNLPSMTRSDQEGDGAGQICNNSLMYGPNHYGNASTLASSTSYYGLSDSSCSALESGTWYLRASGSDDYYTSTNGTITGPSGTCTG